MSFYYLATPYSKYADGIGAAFKAASEQAAMLVRQGIPVFSPIAHTHPIAMHGGIDPLDHEIWLPADEPFMNAAKGLIVCMLSGWGDSYGIKVEVLSFHKAGKPVLYMVPGEIPDELLAERKADGTK